MQSSQQFPHSFNGEQTQEIVCHLGTQKCANLCLKCTKIHLVAGLRPNPLGELKHSPRPPYLQLRGPTSKGRDISINWPQDGTTPLKYLTEIQGPTGMQSSQ